MPTIAAMHPTQVLASSSVTVAAGAMISLSASLSPPLTFVPPLPVAADPIAKTIDIPPVAIMSPKQELAQEFGGRWHQAAVIDTPAMYDDQLGELVIFPPIGDLPASESPFAPVSPNDLKHEVPEKKVAVKPADVCSKYGRHKSWYTHDQHRYWRCV